MGRRRGLFAELQRQSAIQARERQRAQVAAVRAQAAALREAERAQKASVRAAEQATRADARARAQAEKERKQAYLEACQAKVAAQNASLTARVDELDGLLLATLERDDHIDFQTLKKVAEHPAFNPGSDARPFPAPQPVEAPSEPSWGQFAPPAPSGMAKVFGSQRRQEQAVSEARARFGAAHASWEQAVRQTHEQATAALLDHRAREQQRLRRLNQAKARYDRECAERQAAVDEHNREVDQFAAAVSAGSPEAVVEYFDMVLANSIYPEGFPQRHRVAYVPESAQLVVEYELPTLEAIPQVREYRYVKARDETASTARPAKEVRAQYASVVAQVALRTVHELFEADRAGRAETVVFNGIVATTDPSTGRPVTPCLVTLRTTRDVFEESTSPGRADGVSGPPQRRGLEEARGARARASGARVRHGRPAFRRGDRRARRARPAPQPARAHPHRVRRLIQNLFAKMGLDTKQTRPSRDGGVDCVAYDPRPIFGGKVVIQAKRYRHTVDVSSPCATSSAPCRTKEPPRASSSPPAATAPPASSSPTASHSSSSTAPTCSICSPNTPRSRPASSTPMISTTPLLVDGTALANLDPS